jgi:hypothetical protein
MFTLFSRKASASAFTPSAPVSFTARLSIMSVYERKLKLSIRNTNKKMFTFFSRKASDNAFAPSAPIAFPSRLSVVSVYVRKLKISTRKIRRKRRSPGFPGKL